MYRVITVQFKKFLTPPPPKKKKLVHDGLFKERREGFRGTGFSLL